MESFFSFGETPQFWWRDCKCHPVHNVDYQSLLVRMNCNDSYELKNVTIYADETREAKRNDRRYWGWQEEKMLVEKILEAAKRKCVRQQGSVGVNKH